MMVSEVEIASDDIVLRGTLSVPETPRGIIVFVHGSGPMDRDQNGKAATLNTFSVLADDLGQLGFASLRWDKRGVGASDGDYTRAGQSDLIADIVEMIRFARAQNVGSVICCGHSEGTALGPAAAQVAPVDGHVLICPYITSGRDILMQQAQQLDDEIAALKGFQGFIARLSGRPSRKQARLIARLENSDSDTIRFMLRKVPARWLRDFIRADVPAIHRANAAPTLVLTAEFDLQCPPADGAKIAALNQNATHVQIDGLSHLLRATEVSEFADYTRQLKQPQDPRVASQIANWLEKTFPTQRSE